MKKTTQKQQEFDERILEYIRFCNGFGHKCTDSFISARFGISERTVRQSIERLRENNIIWNFQDGLGYFIGETDTEDGNRLNDRWLAQEDARAIKCFIHSRYARSKRKNPNQIRLDGFVAELLAEVTGKSVVERYFEAMKKRCEPDKYNDNCILSGSRCKFWDSCDIAFSEGFIDFTDLTPNQIAALEPYAMKWAESEVTK